MKVASNLVKDIRKYYCDQLCSIYDKDEANAMILILFEHYFNINRVKMALEPDIRLSESEMLKIHFAVKDLLRNKPIQYVTGETEFCDLKFKVNENVLIPRPETAEMVYKIVNSQQSTVNRHRSIIDIGTGSGCIAISLAKMISNSNVYALDISEEASLPRLERFIGENVKVLIEDRIDEDLCIGRFWGQAPDVDGLTVVETSTAQPGDMVDIEILRLNGKDFYGIQSHNN